MVIAEEKIKQSHEGQCGPWEGAGRRTVWSLLVTFEPRLVGVSPEWASGSISDLGQGLVHSVALAEGPEQVPSL